MGEDYKHVSDPQPENWSDDLLLKSCYSEQGIAAASEYAEIYVKRHQLQIDNMIREYCRQYASEEDLGFACSLIRAKLIYRISEGDLLEHEGVERITIVLCEKTYPKPSSVSSPLILEEAKGLPSSSNPLFSKERIRAFVKKFFRGD